MSAPSNSTPTFKVIQSIKIPSQDPSRLGKMDRLVTYQVNGLPSRYTIKVPSENTPQQVQTAIKADYQKEAQYSSMEFK